jgi:hypothetical protein
MRTAVVSGVSILALTLLVGIETSSAGGKKDAKYTISEVMQKAHKSGLLKKVATGKADAGEKKELVELYTALAANKPPAGELAAWKKTTGNMLKLAKAVADGDEKAAKQLGKAVNCGACHKAFKG